AGGGTGGHIFPAVAIANAIKKLDEGVDILFIGAKGKMEMERVPLAGYPIKGIDIAGYNRSSLIKNVTLPFKLMKSFTQVSEIFKGFRPEAVIGVGGYSTYPVLRYAQTKGIPTFIHESNSFAGKSNILLGKKATKVFVAGDGMDKFFPKEKIMMTGNPIRSTIAESQIARSEALRYFKLDPQRKTVLVTGGSLGAKSINEAIAEAVSEFSKKDLQLIWQTGKLFSAQAKEVSEGRRNVWTDDFIGRMEFAFAAADIVVSRSGAMAIAELAVVKKPVIFVPYPFAAEDHQTVNAKKLLDKNAGLMISDADAREHLMNTIVELTADTGKQEELKKNIATLAVNNADVTIATEILKDI
ncbi:MAG: undecaprenyldiphospho-muramoylpentapeptide beta-N-acetylglucosaminyltransferase, partial [Chitinophagaceae bacterium]|nr:undecaprenyldiphospho-muramoylpentapeptide beta-N-acetylglucosaminyltransferase [Chitinophagaceae bacterium]